MPVVTVILLHIYPSMPVFTGLSHIHPLLTVLALVKQTLVDSAADLSKFGSVRGVRGPETL